MCRPWGIRLKRELNEVCMNPIGTSPRVTSPAGRVALFGLRASWICVVGKTPNPPSPLRSAWPQRSAWLSSARGHAELRRSRMRPLIPSFSAALGLAAALGFCGRQTRAGCARVRRKLYAMASQKRRCCHGARARRSHYSSFLPKI
jgi:hypothetical protein